MLAVAEMYVKGVSTRAAGRVMREFGLDSLSSTQVSRAAKLLDDELEAWRTRPLGQITYLVLDARYEKVRQGGIVRDAAVLSAIGVGPDERRRVLWESSGESGRRQTAVKSRAARQMAASICDVPSDERLSQQNTALQLL